MGSKRIAEQLPPTIHRPGWPLAGGYYRKSQVFGEEDRVSTERQRTTISDEARRISHNVDWHCDQEGHRSGRHDHTRPGYMAFKRKVISGALKTIIFYRLDRANRSIKETIWLIEFCQAHAVRLIIIRDGFDSARDGWQARAIRRLYHDAVDNQGEADDAADRMRDAIKHAKARGIPWGTTPKGLLRVGIGNQARWVRRAAHEPHAKRAIDNSAADVRTWFTLWSMTSYEATAEESNQRGLRWYDRDGLPTPVDAGRVRQIVGNLLTYCGYIMPVGGHAKARAFKFSGDGTLLDQLARAYNAVRTPSIEPILNPEDPLDAQLIEQIIIKKHAAQSMANPRGRKSRERVFLLSPWLWYRDESGTQVHLRAHLMRNLAYYATKTKPRLSWYAEEVEEELLSNLRGVAFPPEAITRIRQLVAEKHTDARKAVAQAGLTRARNRLHAIEEMRVELRTRHVGGEITAGQRDDEDARYVTMRQACERQIFEAQRVLNAASDVDRVIGALADLGQSLDRMTATQRKRALSGLFARAEINREGEIMRLQPQQWIAEAFGELVWAWRYMHPTPTQIQNLTPTGLDRNISISLPRFNPSTEWLISRVAA